MALSGQSNETLTNVPITFSNRTGQSTQVSENPPVAISESIENNALRRNTFNMTVQEGPTETARPLSRNLIILDEIRYA